MPSSLSRRSFAAGSFATLFSLPGLRVLAQDAPDFADVDLPVLEITVLAEGYEGVPPELEAGRYVLDVTLADGVDAGGAAFVRPPEELDAEQFLLEIEGATEILPAESTPEPSPGITLAPAGAAEVTYDATFAGGAIGLSGNGEPGQAVIDLPPGEWVLWGGHPDAAQVPVVVQVTGDMPDDLPEPEAGVEMLLSDFEVTLAGELTGGDHLLRIVNEGEEPHHVEIFRAPEGITEEEIEQALTIETGADGEDPEGLPLDLGHDLDPVFATADQSAGTVQWVPVTVESGTYVAFCFYPTREDSTPHALHGQFTVFMVE